MNTKHSLLLVSASALSAGVAQGGIVYSGILNLQQTFSAGEGRQPVNMIGDSVPDFTFGFEVTAAKPYIDARTYVSPSIPLQSGAVDIFGKANKGLPVTAAGTSIGLSYASSFPALTGDRAYFFHDDADALAGDWSGVATTEGYVGIQLTQDSQTHYGWLHFINDPGAEKLTLVDWAYESTPGLPIQTAAVPEPSAAALAALGAAALLTSRRRSKAT